MLLNPTTYPCEVGIIIQIYIFLIGDRGSSPGLPDLNHYIMLPPGIRFKA